MSFEVSRLGKDMIYVCDEVIMSYKICGNKFHTLNPIPELHRGSKRGTMGPFPTCTWNPSDESFAKIHIDLDLPLFGIAYKKESNKAVLLSLVATLNRFLMKSQPFLLVVDVSLERIRSSKES